MELEGTWRKWGGDLTYEPTSKVYLLHDQDQLAIFPTVQSSDEGVVMHAFRKAVEQLPRRVGWGRQTTSAILATVNPRPEILNPSRPYNPEPKRSYFHCSHLERGIILELSVEGPPQ